MTQNNIDEQNEKDIIVITGIDPDKLKKVRDSYSKCFNKKLEARLKKEREANEKLRREGWIV